MSKSSVAFVFAAAATMFAQAPPANRPAQPPPVVSPEVSADRKITFRLYAPEASKVTLRAGDLQPLMKEPPEFKKNEQGIWEATVGPIDPGTYRYTFAVNGVPVVDPRNGVTSESNGYVWSMAVVPGTEFMDTNKVPHGAVAAIHYYSTALERNRRMHVYTPPGYESGKDKYPVFYLLHGAGDCDDSWTSVGRAGFIFDNLIAAKKAKPMIVVMPAGHTSVSGPRMGPGGRDEFAEDFMRDIMPYVDKHYRVLPGRANRAIAGLSMGGNQTLSIAMAHVDQFAYVGVFSSGVFSMNRPPAAPGAAATPPPAGPPAEWEAARKEMLDNPAHKKGMKLIWLKTGLEDRLMPSTKSTVEMLKRHGFNPVFQESPGGHTWINWRIYLNEFTPQLFT
jgi:enterochelin esterase-like enzyme